MSNGSNYGGLEWKVLRLIVKKEIMIHVWQSNPRKNNGNQLKPAWISSLRLRINRITLTLHMPRPLKQVKEINCD